LYIKIVNYLKCSILATILLQILINRSNCLGDFRES